MLGVCARRSLCLTSRHTRHEGSPACLTVIARSLGGLDGPQARRRGTPLCRPSPSLLSRASSTSPASSPNGMTGTGDSSVWTGTSSASTSAGAGVGVGEKTFNPLGFRENLTIPNVITATRIACSPLLGMAIYHDYKTVALVGCVAASVSDWLDGYIAKNYNQMSIVGGFLDPLADKIFIATLTTALTMKGLIPVSLCALYIGRDVAMTGLTFYLRHKTKNEGDPFFDGATSTMKVTPSDLSKVNTGLQMLLVCGTLLGDSLAIDALLVQMEPLWYLTAVTTTASGLGYLDGSGMKALKPRRDGDGMGEEDKGRSVRQ